MRLPSRTLVLVAAAAAFAPRLAPAQSAYGQLQEMCRQTGGDCDPAIPPLPPPQPVQRDGGEQGAGVQQGEAIQSTRPSQSTSHRSVQPPKRTVVHRPPPKKTTDQQIREQFTLGLVQGFLNALLAPPEPEGPRGPTPEELAERERQRVAEFQARAALVREQRAARDAQQSSNMEAMAAVMSAGWDQPAGAAGGGSGAVELRGTTPMLFAPPVYRSPAEAAPPSPAVQRLSVLAAQSDDVAALTAHFADLSIELDAALKDADAIGRMSRRRAEEYQQMERTVAEGVSDAWDRGLSMAVDGLLLGQKKAIERVEEVRSNARAWGELKDLLHQAQRGADFLEDANDKLDDVSALARERDFRQDLEYLADRFGGKYVEYGKSILASARSVREDLQILHRQGELNGFDQRYQQQRARVGKRLATLLADVKTTRRELSARTGIAEKDLALPAVPPPRGSFGTQAPPVPVD